MRLFRKLLKLGLLFIVAVIIHLNSGIMINGNMIGDCWLYLLTGAFVFLKGLAGLIVFSKN